MARHYATEFAVAFLSAFIAAVVVAAVICWIFRQRFTTWVRRRAERGRMSRWP